MFLKVRFGLLFIPRRKCTTKGETLFANQIFTMKEIREKIIDWVQPQRSWSLDPPKSYTDNIQHLNPKSQNELPIRSMKDSFSTAIVPLAEDISLRDYYILSDKKVRFGRILEDLDAFAVWIGYKHNQRPNIAPGKVPFNMVTALVDKIDLMNYSPSPNLNIKFSGMTTWVGSTSMEITMQVDQMNITKTWDPILECKFLMVARDRSDSSRGVFVNPLLEPVKMDKVEADLFTMAVTRNRHRQMASKDSLLKQAPSEDERQLIHNLFMETIDPAAGTFRHRHLPDNAVWMEDTLLKTVIICHPQERNLNNTIFGGFLMRQGYELGWVTAYSFMKTRPKVLRVDDIVFKRPVKIGSILYLSGQVVLTSGTQIMVKVHSEVKNLKTGEMFTCTILHILFQPANLVLGEENEESMLARVIPRSYSEAMLYIMGQRHFLNKV